MAATQPEPPLFRQFVTEDRPILCQVLRLYQLLLGRDPDPQGLAAHTRGLKDGRPFPEIVDQFLTSDEFLGRLHHGEPPSAGLVAMIGPDLFRQADNSERRRELGRRIVQLIHRDVQARSPKLLQHLTAAPVAPDDSDAYHWWADDYDPTCSYVKEHRGQHRPSLSLIMVVNRGGNNASFQTIASIEANLGCDEIELVVVTNGLRIPSIMRYACRSMRLVRRGRQPSVKIRFARSAEGRPQALMSGLSESSGTFVGLINPGDSLASYAVPRVVQELSCSPETDILYTDHDLLDHSGKRHSPHFKTDWDLERLFSGCDLGGLVIYRRELVDRLGGWRAVADDLEDFDLLLRVAMSASSRQFRHIDQVLYHQREPGAESETLLPTRMSARRRLIAEAVRGQGAKALDGPASGSIRVQFPLPDRKPLVSVIIPTRDKADLLRTCLTGLLNFTAYKDIQIIVVDNDSRESTTLDLLAEHARNDKVDVLPLAGEFNWGRANNIAARQAKGSILLLMNNDIEVMHADWLEEIVRQVSRPDVGVVGPKLLYPNGTLQHGGMVLTPRGAALHVMRSAPKDAGGYLSMLQSVRTVSAVTGACMALRVNVFLEAGGIEERHLKVSCSDVDLCLRVGALGYRTVWTPYAVLLHHELATRGQDDTPDKVRRAECEESYLARVWGNKLDCDPFWNRNLEMDERGPYLAVPPRWFAES